MIASLSEYGRSFATRQRGAQIAAQLTADARLRHESDLTVSFLGVSVISGSFADEFISRLAAKTRVRRISFSDMNADVAARIRWAIDHSLGISERRGAAHRLPELVA